MTAATYSEFLSSKAIVVTSSGREVAATDIHLSLFGFQRDLVRWSLRKGRAALFTATGTGKTRMELEWARLTGERTLILTPLGVTRQFVDEGRKLGIDVTIARAQADVVGQITVTNYERLHLFDPSAFGAVALDESSCLKDYQAKTRGRLIEAFRDTHYRLACTATPSPNDVAEMANHAEFLGVMSRVEMLATWFVHDENGWRLKGHAHQPFYRWLSSWAMSLKRPSDLGYPDDGYDLPALVIHPVIVSTDWVPPGQLFPVALKGIIDRSAVRKATMQDRVSAAVDVVNGEPGESWVVWCGLNAEQDAVAAALGDACVSIDGRTSEDARLDLHAQWLAGERRVLVTKPAIFGFGMNWQHCARMAFVGLSDSFETYHQAIRRCWRFGQTRAVHASVVLSEPEEAIYANVKRKEREFEAMTSALVAQVSGYERDEIAQAARYDDTSHGQPMALPVWLAGAA